MWAVLHGGAQHMIWGSGYWHRVSEGSEGWPQLEVNPESLSLGRESPPPHTKLILNLWSQRKSFLLIIVIRRNE